MQLQFYRLRFHLLAQQSIFFPLGKSGNVLRGAFGSILRKLACVPDCANAANCQIRSSCPYALTFEPKANGAGPSGLADWPRPFVFRAAHLDGQTVLPNQPFHFDVHLFQLADPALAYFVLAFAQLAREGIGPQRGKAVLKAVAQLDPSAAFVRTLFDGATLCGSEATRPSSLNLSPPSEPISCVQVRFLTPTELKAASQIAFKPEFGILMARIRDRISTLSDLYGSGPLGLDFADFGRCAARVRMSDCELAASHVSRFSTRTGQRHPLGGFTGFAEYEGDLTQFVPFLHAAQFTGVGRQTTWGKGHISLTVGN